MSAFKFIVSYLAVAMAVVGLGAFLFVGAPSSNAQERPIETRNVFRGDVPASTVHPTMQTRATADPVFVPARPRVMEVGPNGEIREQPPVVQQERVVTEQRRTIRIDSISDLAQLTDEEIARLQRDDVRIDANPFRLRDDVNRGLNNLANQIRSIDYSYQISGVRNSSGTAATAGSGFNEHSRERRRPIR